MRQKEAVSEQGQQLRGDGSKNAPIVIEQVKGETSSKKPQSKRRGTRQSLSTRGGTSSTPAKPTCTRCGKQKHQRGVRCPARDAICHKCNRKGHYSNQCFSKTVAAATNELRVIPNQFNHNFHMIVSESDEAGFVRSTCGHMNSGTI